MGRIIRQAAKIMLVRHAEKPSRDLHIYGVAPNGDHEKDSLSIRGWQRAGALVPFFAPTNGVFQHSLISRPQFLFASRPTKHHGSRRPFETIFPLAEKMGVEINSNFSKDEPEELARKALECDGLVLICWYHENINLIANLILGDTVTAPQDWPDDIYDMVWVFDRLPDSDLYDFNQVPQNLLAGDLEKFDIGFQRLS